MNVQFKVVLMIEQDEQSDLNKEAQAGVPSSILGRRLGVQVHGGVIFTVLIFFIDFYFSEFLFVSQKGFIIFTWSHGDA